MNGRNPRSTPGVERVMRRWLFLALTVAAAPAALAVAASSGGPSATRPAATPSGPLLGVVKDSDALRLARVDPDTLELLRGPRPHAGSPACVPRSGGEACLGLPPWGYSPGRSRLAVARNRDHAVDSLAVVDPRRMRVTTEVRLAGGPVGLVAWLPGERVLALQELCCEERQQVLTIDLAQRRVRARQPLEGSVLGVARTPRALVTLVAPANAIGPARLELAGGDG